MPRYIHKIRKSPARKLNFAKMERCEKRGQFCLLDYFLRSPSHFSTSSTYSRRYKQPTVPRPRWRTHIFSFPFGKMKTTREKLWTKTNRKSST